VSGIAECHHCHAQAPEPEAEAEGWIEWPDHNCWACPRPACRMALEREQRDHYTLDQMEEDWR
jgi:hypothetical protein